MLTFVILFIISGQCLIALALVLNWVSVYLAKNLALYALTYFTSFSYAADTAILLILLFLSRAYSSTDTRALDAIIRYIASFEHFLSFLEVRNIEFYFVQIFILTIKIIFQIRGVLGFLPKTPKPLKNEKFINATAKYNEFIQFNILSN